VGWLDPCDHGTREPPALAYIRARIFRDWRWWIIPVLLIYTACRFLIWQEHELIADTNLLRLFILDGWRLGGVDAYRGSRHARAALFVLLSFRRR